MKQYVLKERISSQDRKSLDAYSDTLSHLLSCRGILSNEEAMLFCAPQYDEVRFNPFLLSNMEKAALRLIEAIKKGENICVFSDYDADGIPGAVVFYDFLKAAGHKNFFNYIPDRQEEGFGLNRLAVNECLKKGATLLITIDCGITDAEEVAYAQKNDIDVIITDHHLPKEELPEAFAIVNPKISPEYPDQMICGAAVAFKLIQAVLRHERFGIVPGAEKWWLDMVGIATLSDMVPLVRENRIFAYFGLLVLRKSRRLGLQKLLRKLKIDQSRLTEDDIAFMVTPRINAASRMGYSYDAFRLLTTNDENEANSLVDHLEKINTERKTTTAHLSKEVRKMIEAKYSPYFSNKVIVAGSPSWQPSLLGLVAGSLAESESKPVFLWGREGMIESLKGSCRGVEGVSVTSIMSALPSGVLTDFGGHHLAGGFSVSYESVHLLEEEIEKAYEREVKEYEAKPVLIDFALEPDDVSGSLLSELEKLAPFGVGNEKPLFMIQNALITEVSFFGKEKNHLKVLIQAKRKPLEAINFFASPELTKKAEAGRTISLVGNLERNFFGVNSIRVRIVDII
ncbi:MAG TPA: single-stranded-DNA-specific exonuclease RecJ [Candidatus Paceibacterota bacterium]|nr:single-stranded-DNA-specific exonuclease RecJ [Candidatus Paceibacterota bacterium]